MITQSELKETLSYDPVTGIFTWLKRVANRVKVGDVAGTQRKDGYINICVRKKPYLAHRLAWLYIAGSFPDSCLDHINHNPSDNRINNLREVTGTENQRNRSLNKRSSSGVNGVGWCKVGSKWRSMITVNGRSIHIGLFIDKFEAICARKSSENKYGFHPNHGR